MAEETKRFEKKGENPEMDSDRMETNTGVGVKLFYDPEDVPGFPREVS